MGKVRLALTPWINHSWQVTLYVTARGLSTSPIPAAGEILEIEFDFIEHRLLVRTSRGTERVLALEPQSVADFYHQLMDVLCGLGITVTIHEMPNEVPDPTPFSQDRAHHSYDAGAAHTFWRVLIQADRLFKHFRSGFLGKVSPVHFFWGSFDLAVTRFSGRTAPPHPGGVPGLPDAVAREAYSHEVSSAGFWPGNDAFPAAAFYSYAYPEPRGFRDRALTAGCLLRAEAWRLHPSRTIRFVLRRRRRPWCSISSPAATQLPQTPAVRSARSSNALSAFRARCVCYQRSASADFVPSSIPAAWEIGTAKFEPEKPDSIAKFTPITFLLASNTGPPDPPEVVCAS